jgi:acyl-CoA thioester hydrolase
MIAVMAAPFSITVQVRYVECDMQGHVFFGHYLTWFDMAHTALIDAVLPGGYAALVSSGVDFVVAESGLRYQTPAHFQDELEISVALEPPTNSSLTSRFAIHRNEVTIATGFLRHVCVNHPEMTKRAWPDEARDAFSPHIVG